MMHHVIVFCCPYTAHRVLRPLCCFPRQATTNTVFLSKHEDSLVLWFSEQPNVR